MIRRYWPLAVPVVWCLAVFALMRPDAVIARDQMPVSVQRVLRAGPHIPLAVKWLVYDESDLTALALRGANASAGRLPGRLDEPVEPDWSIPPATLPKRLDEPQPPLAPRYYLEYPTPTLVILWLGFALPPGDPVPLPPVVADAQQFSVAFHVPRTDAERAVWTRLGRAVRFYVAVMAAALVGLMLLTGSGYQSGQGWGGPVWLAALPGAVYFSLNRFDVLPAAATAAAFFALGRGRVGWSGLFLAIGVMLKLYPVLFAPVVLRYLGFRRGAVWLAAFAGAVGAGFGLSALLLGWDETLGPIRVQLSRTLDERHWTLYGRMLPTELAHAPAVRQAILAIVILLAVVTRPADVAGVLRRCGAVLAVFVVLAVFWSPQWFVWFLPLLIPLGRTRRWVVAAAVALDVSNYFSFPILFWGLAGDSGSVVVEGIAYARGVLWFGLAAGLTWDEWRSRRRPAPPDLADAGFVAAFLAAAGSAGKPRGLRWVSATPAGSPLLVRDRDDGGWIALAPLVVQFDPDPDGGLAEVPQAREPRPVTAVFRWDGRRWNPDGRAVFNLSPAELVERSGGRYSPAG